MNPKVKDEHGEIYADIKIRTWKRRIQSKWEVLLLVVITVVDINLLSILINQRYAHITSWI